MPPPIPSPEDQERLYPAIGEALLKSVPEDWSEILLRIKSVNAGKIEFEIFGPAGMSNLRVPDNSLFQPAIELYELFARDAKAFASCDFALAWDDSRETWRFNAKYAYPPERLCVLPLMADSVRQFPYRASPGVMVGCLAVFGVFTAIGSYAALSNDRGLTISGLISLGQTGATVFWWCLAGICASFCLLAIVLPAWWAFRGERVMLSGDSIQVPTSLFKRGVTLIRFDDLVGVSETIVSRQRMLNIAHRNGQYTIPANMLSAEAYQSIRDALIEAVKTRGGMAAG